MLARWCLILAYLLYITYLEHFVERASVVTKALFLAAAISYVATRPRRPAILILWAACTAMVVLLGAATSYPDFSWLTLLLAMNQFTIIYFLLAVEPDEKDRDTLLILIAVLPTLSVLLGAVYSAAHLSALFRLDTLNGGFRLAGSMISAYLSALAMCGTFAAMILAATLGRIKYYPLVAVNFLIMLLAGGRSPVAAAAIACAVAFYAARPVPVLYKMVGSVIAGGMVFIVTVTIGHSFLNRLLQGGDSGREILWTYVRSLIAQYPWTGIGYGHQFWSTPRYVFVYTKTSAAHNEFLRVESELGVVGMPLFYAMLAAAVFIAWRRGNRSLLLPAGFAAFLLLCATDNALAQPDMFLMMVMASFASIRAAPEAGATPAPSALGRWRQFRKVEGRAKPPGYASINAASDRVAASSEKFSR